MLPQGPWKNVVIETSVALRQTGEHNASNRRTLRRIDVGKKFITVCVLIGTADAEPSSEKRMFGTFNAELAALRDWLCKQGCTHVAMESIGPYWQPVFNILEDAFVVVLANGEQVKARRGHKTDWKDCTGLADLLRHGMIRPSFIPPRVIRELRDRTRRSKRIPAMAPANETAFRR